MAGWPIHSRSLRMSGVSRRAGSQNVWRAQGGWPTQAAFAWVGICGLTIARIIFAKPTSVYSRLRFAVCGVASHPSAQNALGWGTPRLGWRTQKASVGHPPHDHFITNTNLENGRLRPGPAANDPRDQLLY